MRRYETTYILRPNLGETLITEVIDRTNDIIKDDGGTIISLDRWGAKKLAYEIKKENLGFYVYFDFAAPATTVLEMERIFRLDDNVLRFLTIKLADSIDQQTIDAEAELAAAAIIAQQEEAAAAESSATEAAEEETKKEPPAETKAEEVAEEKSEEKSAADETEEEVTSEDVVVAEEESEKETAAAVETETKAPETKEPEAEEAETADTPSDEEPSEEDKK